MIVLCTARGIGANTCHKHVLLLLLLLSAATRPEKKARAFKYPVSVTLLGNLTSAKSRGRADSSEVEEERAAGTWNIYARTESTVMKTYDEVSRGIHESRHVQSRKKTAEILRVPKSHNPEKLNIRTKCTEILGW